MICIEETDHRYDVRPSTVPGAGLGLFAKVPLKKGDCLELVGVYVPVQSITDIATYYAGKYKFAGSDKNPPNRYVVPMGYAAFVNHDQERQNVQIVAAKGRSTKNPNAGQIVYLFLRDISPGEELLGDYGPQWEQTFRWLEKVDEDWQTFVNHNLYRIKEFQDRFLKCQT